MFTIDSKNNINKIYTQSLLNKLPNGIYCAEMDSNCQYLYIGSFASNNTSHKQTSNGITVWRVLNYEPWLKQVQINNDQNDSKSKVNNFIFH